MSVILQSILFFLISINIYAASNMEGITGYQQFPFGMKKNDILATHFCDFQYKRPSKEDNKLQIRRFSCHNFPLGSYSVNATWVFFKSKEVNDYLFMRLVVYIPDDLLELILFKMKDTYQLYKSPEEKYVKRFYENYPGSKFCTFYEAGTIFICAMRDEANNRSAILVYQSKFYDEIIKKRNNNKDLIGF